MRAFLTISLFFLGLMGTAACGSKSGGTGGSGDTGTGGALSCPLGGGACWLTGVCPSGSYCLANDSCGDLARCEPIPSACRASPSCDCLVANVPGVQCSGDGTIYLLNMDGSSECCP